MCLSRKMPNMAWPINRKDTKMECEDFLEPIQEQEYDDDL